MGSRIVLLAIALAGCNERNFTPLPPGDGGARVDAGADARCPATPVFTGMACTVDQIGSTCGGQSMCACGGTDFRTVPTSCTCSEGGLGRVYQCADACATACSDGGSPVVDGGTRDGGGTRDAGPPAVTCAAFCAHLNTITCPEDFSGCEGACESLRDRGCIPELEAFLSCGARSPVACDPEYGIPMATGCAAEDAAWGACVGG